MSDGVAVSDGVELSASVEGPALGDHSAGYMQLRVHRDGELIVDHMIDPELLPDRWTAMQWAAKTAVEAADRMGDPIDHCEVSVETAEQTETEHIEVPDGRQ